MTGVLSAKTPHTRNAEVSEEDARMALAAYESAMNARQEADQARRQALDTLEAWLLQKDIDHAPLPGQAKERLVKLVRTTVVPSTTRSWTPRWTRRYTQRSSRSALLNLCEWSDEARAVERLLSC